MGKRIAVLGAGANGASIAADLIRAGLDVTLIEQWPEHVEAMRDKGIIVNMPEETQITPVDVKHLCEVATFTQQFDVVLMLLKAYDSRWGAELIKPHLADDGLLVGVQNGMSALDIADVVGERRSLGCVIEITSMMFEPGVVERHSAQERSWFALGALSADAVGRVGEVAELLRHSGTVETVDDILSAKWMKLVSNCTTLVTTATLGLPMLEALEVPEMRAFMLRSGEEALAAGLAAGHRTLPIFGLDAEAVRDRADVVEVLLDTLTGGFVLPDSKTTVLQDWIKRRHSEVDDLNGRVVAVAREHGLDAPANAAVVEVAHRIEKGEILPSVTNLQLLLELERVARAR